MERSKRAIRKLYSDFSLSLTEETEMKVRKRRKEVILIVN